MKKRMHRHTEQRRLYRKYEVCRTDGSSAPGRKHARCAYFVLDLHHDRYVEFESSDGEFYEVNEKKDGRPVFQLELESTVEEGGVS